MKIFTHQAINALLPGVEWTLSGEDLKTLVIHTPGVQAPSQADVDAYMASKKSELDSASATLKNKNSNPSDKVNALVTLLGL